MQAERSQLRGGLKPDGYGVSPGIALVAEPVHPVQQQAGTFLNEQSASKPSSGLGLEGTREGELTAVPGRQMQLPVVLMDRGGGGRCAHGAQDRAAVEVVNDVEAVAAGTSSAGPVLGVGFGVGRLPPEPPSP